VKRPARHAKTLRGAIRSHLGSTPVARVVYGAIIGLALIVALEQPPPAAATMIASLLGTPWRSRSPRSTPRSSASRRVSGTASGASSSASFATTRSPSRSGVAFPAVYFLVAAAGAIDVDAAFRPAKWTALALIGFYGFCAASPARRCRAQSPRGWARRRSAAR
jgi:hypothetical protein